MFTILFYTALVMSGHGMMVCCSSKWIMLHDPPIRKTVSIDQSSAMAVIVQSFVVAVIDQLFVTAVKFY